MSPTLKAGRKVQNRVVRGGEQLGRDGGSDRRSSLKISKSSTHKAAGPLKASEREKEIMLTHYVPSNLILFHIGNNCFCTYVANVLVFVLFDPFLDFLERLLLDISQVWLGAGRKTLIMFL